MLDDLIDAVNLLNSIEKDYDEWKVLRENYDNRLTDIYHYIQFKTNLHPTRDFYIMKEIKRIRILRADVKAKIRTYERFIKVKQNLSSPDRDKMIQKLQDQHDSEEKPYKNRVYEDVEALTFKEDE